MTPEKKDSFLTESKWIEKVPSKIKKKAKGREGDELSGKFQELAEALSKSYDSDKKEKVLEIKIPQELLKEGEKENDKDWRKNIFKRFNSRVRAALAKVNKEREAKGMAKLGLSAIPDNSGEPRSVYLQATEHKPRKKSES